MSLTKHIAKQFRDVHFGGNWTAVCLKEVLADVSWQQATEKVNTFHTIAALVFHINYYVSEVSNVLEGAPLKASDKFSFDCPPVICADDWQNLLAKTWNDAEKFSLQIENLPEPLLWEDFHDKKYGTWYRNIHGITEHIHYHLGQMVLIKKMLQQNNEND